MATGKRDYFEENDEGETVPTRCVDCGLPMFYDTAKENYYHAVTRFSPTCFNQTKLDVPDPKHPILAGRHVVLHLSKEDMAAIWPNMRDQGGKDRAAFEAMIKRSNEISKQLDCNVLWAAPNGKYMLGFSTDEE